MNHSLRATGTTALFSAGIPECIIQKRTDHRCLDALRTYERVTPAQEQAVAQILVPVATMATIITTFTATTTTPTICTTTSTDD